MSRYIAFLRAINVGGHVVKMENLRRHFQSLGFANVETFIASGNVIFESPSQNARELEKKIEAKLLKALGYEVATFLRSPSELLTIANHNPFPKIKPESRLYIAFVSEPPDKPFHKILSSFKTSTDDFHIHQRQIYWHCQTSTMDSKFSGSVLEKALKAKATLRNSTTIQRLAAKYPAT